MVASDGAQDNEYRFGDLGNAVRKIRIDLGVPDRIQQRPDLRRAGAAGQKGKRVLLGDRRGFVTPASTATRRTASCSTSNPQSTVVSRAMSLSTRRTSQRSRIDTDQRPVLRRAAVRKLPCAGFVHHGSPLRRRDGVARSLQGRQERFQAVNRRSRNHRPRVYQVAGGLASAAGQF